MHHVSELSNTNSFEKKKQVYELHVTENDA